MDSAAREAPFMARGRDTDESRCLMALLPPEMKIQIMSYISTQQSLSRLAQSCRAWYGPATQELYTRDAKEHRSLAIKWMTAHAVDEQTTDSALRTLETSRRWGGQIDALKPRLPRSYDDYDSSHDQTSDDDDDSSQGPTFKGNLHEVTTALHYAVLVGNVRLTKMLLDMKASLIIPCSNLLRRSMRSEEVMERVSYFLRVFRDADRYGNGLFGSAFPIFLAFIQRDADMCKLLVEHGAGREAMIVNFRGEPKAISILHFAAADPTTDYRHWQCLFDGFREYIDEPCPQNSQSTPLHIALINGCTQGMQIAVEAGADKEARNSASRTPLFTGVSGVLEILTNTRSGRSMINEFTICIRKFVELGANVNPDGDSVLLYAVRSYALHAPENPGMRHLIYLLLDHHADIHATSRSLNTNLVNEIFRGFIGGHDQDPETKEVFKELLSDLVDRGLNLTILAPGLHSPLYCALVNCARPEWFFDLLCEKGAIIHEDEVDSVFCCWCDIPRLWRMNKYDAWWQHRGQEDEMFLKWCEHPYNVWWWQHVKHISPDAVTEAYRTAFEYESRQLYDILTHLPLPEPSDDVFVKIASESFQPWSWRQVVLRGFQDDFVVTWRSFHWGDNMIHVTVGRYIDRNIRYAAADAIQDILYLRDKGVDMTWRNAAGKAPLDILLESSRSRNGFMEVAAVLEGKAHKVQELA
ncbi:uncharacterized protein CPUR_08655 [Claviceps purpurea 20.1]|uniref:F-box domain-containing protein n=1 Tax=Claviceps purpurea (strain 20.1) TaxID=1111077 RepID=M1WIM1_CLAP2|nr:uncharacterized protein CPUR_08655 [Claviceps purpurea 20.1]